MERISNENGPLCILLQLHEAGAECSAHGPAAAWRRWPARSRSEAPEARVLRPVLFYRIMLYYIIITIIIIIIIIRFLLHYLIIIIIIIVIIIIIIILIIVIL